MSSPTTPTTPAEVDSEADSSSEATSSSEVAPSKPPPPTPLDLPEVGRSFSTFCNELAKEVSKLIQRWHKFTIRPTHPIPRQAFRDGDLEPEFQCLWCVKDGLIGRLVPGTNTAGLEKIHFIPFTPDEFVTEIEKFFTLQKSTRFGPKEHSLGTTQAKVILASSALRDALPRVDKIFFYPIPILIHETRTRKPGAKSVQVTKKPLLAIPGFGSYQDPASGEIVFYYCHRKWRHYISVQRARRILRELYDDFPFTDPAHHRVNAIAHLLTPFCQSLIGWKKKAPMWFFTADQPRSGKDYLAMISPIIHEGVAVQDPPIEEDSELKRRITSAIVSGRRFQHFANCRSEALDSPCLEAAITSEYWSDRVIGTSASPIMVNDLIFSISYNGEPTITKDLLLRSREVNLTNPCPGNTRSFKVKNLHTLISRFRNETHHWGLCRRNIISALFAFIREWQKMGCPKGKTYTSFPEWAEVVGGIMESCGLGDPTASPPVTLTAGLKPIDVEFSRLGIFLATYYANDFLTAGKIYDVIRKNPEEFPLLSRAGSTSLGIQLPKFDPDSIRFVTLSVNDLDSSRKKYGFALAIPQGVEPAAVLKAFKVRTPISHSTPSLLPQPKEVSEPPLTYKTTEASIPSPLEQEIIDALWPHMRLFPAGLVLLVGDFRAEFKFWEMDHYGYISTPSDWVYRLPSGTVVSFTNRQKIRIQEDLGSHEIDNAISPIRDIKEFYFLYDNSISKYEKPPEPNDDGECSYRDIFHVPEAVQESWLQAEEYERECPPNEIEQEIIDAFWPRLQDLDKEFVVLPGDALEKFKDWDEYYDGKKVSDAVETLPSGMVVTVTNRNVYFLITHLGNSESEPPQSLYYFNNYKIEKHLPPCPGPIRIFEVPEVKVEEWEAGNKEA